MAILIQESGQLTEILVESLKDLQEKIGGKIKFVNINYEKIIIINEHQSNSNLSKNKKASDIAKSTILGNAILCDRSELYY